MIAACLPTIRPIPTVFLTSSRHRREVPMRRRAFFGSPLAAGTLFAGSAAAAPATPGEPEVTIERDRPGRPHSGKVLAAIQPHCDDVPLFAAGTVLKLIAEGYRGILIRTSNDEMAGRGATVGEVVLNNERDTRAVMRLMRLEKLFDLGYRNHLMDGTSRLELRARLIFIFRLMKVDTVLCYDPWGSYEENPDHYVTAACVEAACWMAGSRWDYPEHFEAGLEPYAVREKYYFARGPQLVNRVVDISSYVDKKAEVNRANVTQGPAGESGAALRRRLAAEGKRLPVLGDNDETANLNYIKQFVLAENREWGQRHGLAYAEPFHHIGPDRQEDALKKYIARNAVPL
jgi:LmbE family N-acetylglucosaminyl deacetylase